MKIRVNLYHPEFHPKLRLLSLHIVIACWIFTAVFCSLLYFYLASEQDNLKTEFTQIERHKLQQETLIKELQKAVDNQEVDPLLLQQIEQLQQLLTLKKRVLNELSGQANIESHGFSKLMLDLAEHNPSGLWLTHVNLNGINVLMEGATNDSALVPKWLNSLGKTDYFSGQEFANTHLYLDSEEQLNFTISTGKEPNVEKDSNNE